MRSRVVSNGIEREREKWREPDCISSSLFVQTQVSVFLPCPDMTCRARQPAFSIRNASVSAYFQKKKSSSSFFLSDGWNLAVYITTRSICGPSLIIDCWKVFFFSKRVHSSNDLGLCCCGRPVGYEERNRKRMNPPLIHRLFPFLFCGINL